MFFNYEIFNLFVLSVFHFVGYYKIAIEMSI